jgi:small subunit ribosomal protein S1
MMDSGEILTARVTGYNKGGWCGAWGQPDKVLCRPLSSHLARRNHEEGDPDVLPQYVGEELPLKVIEVNRRRRRLILSERAAVREWRVKQRERLLSELRVGGVYTGRVSNLCDFGAFVDFGGIDGLVHLSELSWSRSEHPAEALRVGQEVQVLVLNMDLERQRVGLSIKRTRLTPGLRQASATR